jgi:hypothetical protein
VSGADTFNSIRDFSRGALRLQTQPRAINAHIQLPYLEAVAEREIDHASERQANDVRLLRPTRCGARERGDRNDHGRDSSYPLRLKVHRPSLPVSDLS